MQHDSKLMMSNLKCERTDQLIAAYNVSVPCGAASQGPWGQNENPIMLSFGCL